MQESGPAIFYINLDRVPERRKFMHEALTRVGLADQAERFPAIDARDPAALRKAGYRPGGWRPRWSLTPTLIACFESHRALWKRIVDRELPQALIMEDDILLSAQLGKALSALEKAHLSFDVIRFDACHGRHRYGPMMQIGDLRLRPILQVVPSAACYLLSLSGAKKLVADSQVYSDHTDDFLFSPRKNWKMLQLWPAVAIQGMFAEIGDNEAAGASVISESERLSVGSEQSPPSKGPAAYRLTKELKRMSRRAKRKFGGDARILAQGGVIDCPPLAEDLPPYRI